jgi:putative peptidoglycan lipid II flippase
MLMLLWFLRRKIGPFGGRGIVACGLKSLAAAVPMAVTVRYVCGWADWSLSGHKTGKALVLGGAIALGVVIYGLCVRLLRSDEALEVSALLRRKLGQKRSIT